MFFSMPKCKAPCSDGFLVEFFIDAWDVVGEDSLAAAKEFFISGRLFRKFNMIALNPKVIGADDCLNSNWFLTGQRSIK